jgi:hypothetical protein
MLTNFDYYNCNLFTNYYFFHFLKSNTCSCSRIMLWVFWLCSFTSLSGLPMYVKADTNYDNLKKVSKHLNLYNVYVNEEEWMVWSLLVHFIGREVHHANFMLSVNKNINRCFTFTSVHTCYSCLVMEWIYNTAEIIILEDNRKKMYMGTNKFII